MVGRLNRKLRGWANYFDLGAVNRAYNVVNYHVTSRLRRWLCKKHKVRGPGYSRYPDRYLYRNLSLYQLNRVRRSFPSATV
jgi:RNA-directed DNA polymerase